MTQATDQAFDEFLAQAAAGFTKKRTRKQVEAWHRALEAERYDISYRRVTAKRPQAAHTAPKTPTATTADYVARIKRDKAYYDAGRFAQGARDPEAKEAFELINRKATN